MLLELALGDAYGAGFENEPAIAEVIVSGKLWTAELLAERFVEVFQRDPREGYAAGLYAFLQHVQNGQRFLQEIRPMSDKSGVAMRAAPIGIYPTIEQVIERCSRGLAYDPLFAVSSGTKTRIGSLSGAACAWTMGQALVWEGAIKGVDECAHRYYGCGDQYAHE